MKEIELPGSEVVIKQAIFGTSRLGGTVQHYNKKEALGILEQAVDFGITTFDTANIYAQGNSEKLLGAAMKRQREKIIIATKGGYAVSTKGRLLSMAKPIIRKIIGSRPGIARAAGKVRGGQIQQDFSKAALTKSLHDSLKRLKTDYIDIYQLHSPDQKTLEKGEVFETLAEFQKEGKIRAAGVSLLSWQHLEYCFGKGISFAQLEADFLSGIDRGGDLTSAAEGGIVVAARQAFGSGLMAKDSGTWSVEQFGNDLDRFSQAKARMARLKSHGDPFEVILKHLLHSSEFPAFLFATTNPGHLAKNLDGINAECPSSESIDELRGVFSEKN